jgi:hypothetical protein
MPWLDMFGVLVIYLVAAGIGVGTLRAMRKDDVRSAGDWTPETLYIAGLAVLLLAFVGLH